MSDTPQKTIPCEDCICLAVCKTEVLRDDESGYKRALRHNDILKYNDILVIRLSQKCSLIHDYVTNIPLSFSKRDMIRNNEVITYIREY